MNGLPLICLVFLAALTVVVFWRLVVMIVAAALLSVLVLGVLDAASWLGGLR